jgi:putative Holliday junction resolvase
VEIKGRILGLDFGSSRVGVAVSDPLQIIASPLTTIKNKSPQYLLTEINTITQKKGIETIVIGCPLGMNGKDTYQTKSTKQFSEYLKGNGYKVILEDERLTSVIAKKKLINQNKNTGKNKYLIDQTAAALILQSYLDRGAGAAV